VADLMALIGTWRMISWTKRRITTGEITHAMGPNPIGYIAYHADGRMMALVVDSRRAELKGSTPSDEEKIRLFDSMLAYSAKYTLLEDRLIHHVDVTCNPAWVGNMQRPYKIEGDSLIISEAPGTDPLTGEEVIYRMEFARLVGNCT
jgi:Lipocalin-like domain